MTIWAKERYDWSDPGTVSWTVEESNFCKPGSRVIATITAANGGSGVHVDWERHPVNATVQLMFWIKATRGRPITGSIRQAAARLTQAGDAGPETPPPRRCREKVGRPREATEAAGYW